MYLPCALQLRKSLKQDGISVALEDFRDGFLKELRNEDSFVNEVLTFYLSRIPMEFELDETW